MEDRREFNPHELLDRAVDALMRDPIPDDVPPDRVAQLAAVVRRAADRPYPITIFARISNMNMKAMTRIGAAAAVLAALVGLVFWLGPGRGEALALVSVAEALNEVQSARWKTTAVVKFPQEEPRTMNELGMFLAPSRERKEYTVEGEKSIGIFDARTNKTLVLVPATKTATVLSLKDSPPGARSGGTFLDLRKLVLDAQSGGPAIAESIGVQVIDGRRAEGFRLQIGANEATIWADPKTALPIRVEMVMSGPTEVRIVMTDFEVDVDLDESLFSLDVPEGYTVEEVQLLLPKKPIVPLANTLGLVAEHNGGVFPPSLRGEQGIDGFLPRIGPALEKKYGRDSPELRKAGSELAAKSAGAFGMLGLLRPEHDWHYAGKDVKLNTPNRPIFWWKPTMISDHYEVIYADLTVRDVAPEDLPKVTKGIAEAETAELPAADEAAFVDGMRAWLKSSEEARTGIDKMKKAAQQMKEMQEQGKELPEAMPAVFVGAALDAGYPDRLDIPWLHGAFFARSTWSRLDEMDSELNRIPGDLDEADQEEAREKIQRAYGRAAAVAAHRVSAEATRKAAAIAGFYQKLVDEQREPEYFGAVVEPGDSAAILLRWKLDDARHRVIYGDLRAETVDSRD